MWLPVESVFVVSTPVSIHQNRCLAKVINCIMMVSEFASRKLTTVSTIWRLRWNPALCVIYPHESTSYTWWIKKKRRCWLSDKCHRLEASPISNTHNLIIFRNTRGMTEPTMLDTNMKRCGYNYIYVSIFELRSIYHAGVCIFCWPGSYTAQIQGEPHTNTCKTDTSVTVKWNWMNIPKLQL